MSKANAGRERFLRELPLLWVALAVVAADQLTKYLVRAHMSLGESIPAEGPVRLTHTTNSGGAFGLFANQAFLLTLTSVVLILFILVSPRFLHLESLWPRLGLGLVWGGAVGNLIDRLRCGEVTDFIDLGDWPVFNLADSAITVGIIVLIAFLIFTSRDKSPPG